MAVVNTGDFPINATTTSGSDLADRLNRLKTALDSNNANLTRPTYLTGGAVWSQSVSGGGYKLNFYDGTRDVQIGTVSAAGVGAFGNSAPVAPAFSATATYAAGDIIVDSTGTTYLEAKTALTAGTFNAGSWNTITNLIANYFKKAGGTITGATTFSAGVTYQTTLTGGTGVITIGTNQLYKDASGKFGFGNTAPTEIIHVTGGNVRAGQFKSTGERGVDIDGYGTVGSTYLCSFAKANPNWSTNYIELQAVHVPGNWAGMRIASSFTNFDFQSSGGYAYAQGNWVDGSDGRVKINRTPIGDALTKVVQLTGYTYDRTDIKDYDGENKKEAGLIAQDVREIIPVAVTTTGQKVESDLGGEPFLSLNYNAVTALLVNAVKELKAEVDALKAQLNP